MSVLPPRVHWWRWWASVHAAGIVQPCGPALLVPDPHRDPLTRGEQPLGAAQEEGLAGAVEDQGQDLGGAGQPHRLGGGDQVAGVEAGGAELGGQGVVVDGDHDLGRGAAMDGQLVGGDRFEHRREGVPEQHRLGQDPAGGRISPRDGVLEVGPTR